MHELTTHKYHMKNSEENTSQRSSILLSPRSFLGNTFQTIFQVFVHPVDSLWSPLGMWEHNFRHSLLHEPTWRVKSIEGSWGLFLQDFLSAVFPFWKLSSIHPSNIDSHLGNTDTSGIRSLGFSFGLFCSQLASHFQQLGFSSRRTSALLG